MGERDPAPGLTRGRPETPGYIASCSRADRLPQVPAPRLAAGGGRGSGRAGRGCGDARRGRREVEDRPAAALSGPCRETRRCRETRAAVTCCPDPGGGTADRAAGRRGAAERRRARGADTRMSHPERGPDPPVPREIYHIMDDV